MTLQQIRENLEHARKGLEELETGDRYTDDRYVKRMPSQHEAKLYSICEGLIVEIERLQEQLAAHKADKSAGVHRPTRDEVNAAIVAKIDGRIGEIKPNDNRFVGMNPPQFYLMPGVTGDSVTDGANREHAIWNAHQRRLWEAEHGPLCKACFQSPHASWCTS